MWDIEENTSANAVEQMLLPYRLNWQKAASWTTYYTCCSLNDEVAFPHVIKKLVER